jgi:protein-disulfide isomerase
MIHYTRRHMMLAAASLALASAARADDKVDLSDINTAQDGDQVLGPADAKVTMVEYGSASCPHCAKFYTETFTKLKTDYIDTNKMKFIFREFPHNDQGLAAFMVARCAPKDKYFALLDVFFSTQPTWVPDAYNGLKNIAQQAGMSADDFDKCLKNEDVAKSIMAVRDKGAKQYGINGIPTIFVNGKLAFSGEASYDDVKKLIDPLLK